MRRMVAPGVWRDEGPGAAVGGAGGATRELGARNVGHMIADRSAGPTPQVRSDGTAKRLSIKPL